jgi:hypothetical protein
VSLTGLHQEKNFAFTHRSYRSSAQKRAPLVATLAASLLTVTLEGALHCILGFPPYFHRFVYYALISIDTQRLLCILFSSIEHTKVGVVIVLVQIHCLGLALVFLISCKGWVVRCGVVCVSSVAELLGHLHVLHSVQIAASDKAASATSASSLLFDAALVRVRACIGFLDEVACKLVVTQQDPLCQSITEVEFHELERRFTLS